MIGARSAGLLAFLCLLGFGFGPTVAANEAPSPPVLNEETEFFVPSRPDSPLDLQHRFLEPTSVRLQVEGVPWEVGEDYKVQARSGLIIPLRAWSQDESPALVVVRYRYLPMGLPARRDLWAVSPPPVRDPVTGMLTSDVPGLDEAAWRGGQLQVTGSKTVQVNSGSRREMTVDQNLRLTILGQLTDDIAVRAFLSDDNLPVIPEGNTEELRDIDKVLVELKARNWDATLGDFVARRGGTVFGDYRRKLQGFSLEARPGDGNVEVLAGSPRGLYRTLQIRGQEANQGPYYLGAAGGGENLFLVAGSERVTLDGEVMTRGADRDYIIDYVRGTITFTYRRLITAESTIVVEYEQGEGPYGRTVVGAGAGTAFQVPGTSVGGYIQARVIREKDDPHRLRSGSLGPEDEAVLAAAGDDPLLAVASGVAQVAAGEGLYDQSQEAGKTIYVHNPDGGAYNLSLFYVGSGQGDYELDFLTETGQRIFKHSGEGLGNYRIGRPLDRPQQQSIATLSSSLGDTSGTHFRAEMNFSSLDANLLSEIADEDNQARAGQVEVHLAPRDVGLGRLGLSGFHESRQAGYAPFQVHKTVFDYDRWGLSDRARREGFLDQKDSESGLQGQWDLGQGDRRLGFKGQWGRLRHGEGIEGDRLSGQLGWAALGLSGEHREQEATARDLIDPLDVTRNERLHRLAWGRGPVQPEVRYRQQSWEDETSRGSRASGFRLQESSAALRSRPGSGLTWRLEFQRSLADSLLEGGWHTERDGRTYSAAVTSPRFVGMRLVGEGTMRRVEQPGGPEQTTRLGRVNLAGRWERTASDWSLGYRLDNSRIQVLDRQIVFVGENQGDYNQDGDYLGPDLGDHDLVQAATDSLLATTAVVADLHWRQGFSFLGEKRWFGAWSAMTLASLEGRSTDEEVGELLLLAPAAIFNDDHTVLGQVTFSEELTFLQHIPTVDLRAKFDFRQTMDRQYADHPEDRLARGWQANTTVNLGRRTSWRGKWSRRLESRFSQESALSARRSYASVQNEYETGLGYRPNADVRLNLMAAYLDRRDGVSGVTQTEWALRPNTRVRLQRQWTLQADVRLSDVSSGEVDGSIRPWFYPQPGSNVESSLRLGWEPSPYLDVGLSYFARKQGERGWQHDFRLESTARF